MPKEYAPVNHELISKLFYHPDFHVDVIPDVAGVSFAGALKNIMALAAGFVEWKRWGRNAKAAIIRVRLT
jgi:glycerol-3-phosphate dehydrogenase (NAD+)